MQYLLPFLEGIIAFISPCLLPMLPVYISYFTANGGKNRGLRNSVFFVLGFTLVFVTLGAFAGFTGRILREYASLINAVAGLVIVIFGLNFIGILRISFLNKTFRKEAEVKNPGMLASFVFGVVFSIGWSPCTGPFLGAALTQAGNQASMLKGVVMLLLYSLGLGIPFIISALLIDKLKGAFDFIKQHYKVVNVSSGILLVIVGILIMTGYMGYFLSLIPI